MSKVLKLKGGNTSQHSTFIGANREVTVDTDKKTLVVHDGITPGGHELAKKEDIDNIVGTVAEFEASLL